jgi:hypothetical protein
MSIFFIPSIASNARLAAAESVSDVRDENVRRALRETERQS